MGTDRDTGKFGFKFLHARFPLPVNYPFSRINLPLPRRPRDKPEIPLEPYIDTIQVVQVPFFRSSLINLFIYFMERYEIIFT